MTPTHLPPAVRAVVEAAQRLADCVGSFEGCAWDALVAQMYRGPLQRASHGVRLALAALGAAPAQDDEATVERVKRAIIHVWNTSILGPAASAETVARAAIAAMKEDNENHD